LNATAARIFRRNLGYGARWVRGPIGCNDPGRSITKLIRECTDGKSEALIAAADPGRSRGGHPTMLSQTCAVRAEAHPRPAAAPRDNAVAIVQAVRGLRILALRWSRGPDEAEDLMQDTAERALRNIHRFHSGTNATAWVRAIMYHLAVDETRQRRRHLALKSAYRCQPGWGEQEPPAEEQGPPPAMTEVQAAVERLDEPFRTIFRLWAIQGRNYHEISDLLGIPMGTVATRLMRGRGYLRRLLTDSAPAGDERCGPGPL
jgi:RNA polymerase sigma-70 factor (ECF subfamily)